jgi:C-terminal processing protease CtpA/Prc
LCCRIRRDKYGNLGIQIKAGSDGGLYVQSVVPGGPAAAVGNVHRGTVLLYELYYV